MASILESLAGSISPEMTNMLGNAIGVDGKTLQQGLDVVGPLLTGQMADSAGSESGLNSLMGTLGKVADAEAAGTFDPSALLKQFAGSGGGSDMMGSLLNTLTGSGGAAGSDPLSGFLGSMFGDGLGAVGGTLDKKLGFPVSGLIPIVAPFLVKTVSQFMKRGNLDARGVAGLLQQERDNFMAGGGEAATLVQEAQQAGKDAIALKGKYSAQEWSTIRLAPMAAAGVVMGASPSGGSGMAQELGAAMLAVEATKKLSDPVSLLSVAFDAPLSQPEVDAFMQGAPKEKMMAAVRNAVSLVGSKDALALEGYRTLIMNVATAAAEATKEGGFLGFGGKKISKDEEVALAEIKAAIS
jgi:hypothetical protein